VFALAVSGTELQVPLRACLFRHSLRLMLKCIHPKLRNNQSGSSMLIDDLIKCLQPTMFVDAALINEDLITHRLTNKVSKRFIKEVSF
jgi:hypothetical protein